MEGSNEQPPRQENPPKISLLEEGDIKKFLADREILPEDYSLIEQFGAFSQNDIILNYHNLFNLSKDNSSKMIEQLITSLQERLPEARSDEERKEIEQTLTMHKTFLQFVGKYPWYTANHFTRVLERIEPKKA